MSKPFEHGFDIIGKCFERLENECLKNIYFHGNANGTNEKYKTFGEYKKTVKIPVETKTEKEILQDVKNILDNFC